MIHFPIKFGQTPRYFYPTWELEKAYGTDHEEWFFWSMFSNTNNFPIFYHKLLLDKMVNARIYHAPVQGITMGTLY